ncbi:unnamed protein product [Cyberlindnera jadinii]|uniref:Uncharacterized protein n=1 Tax=Cyberlindnera jadinii (strain ATCC 18201 / CBS 1600 / BCRC 20928 / JCM 3617 / NBRC 0987 / NRRL Y-1542) TaxID=983966 RepID=A0A0H5BYC2_CYBJN|nr:unnamed protein product [Cyberlindnera jadinii]
MDELLERLKSFTAPEPMELLVDWRTERALLAIGTFGSWNLWLLGPLAAGVKLRGQRSHIRVDYASALTSLDLTEHIEVGPNNQITYRHIESPL